MFQALPSAVQPKLRCERITWREALCSACRRIETEQTVPLDMSQPLPKRILHCSLILSSRLIGQRDRFCPDARVPNRGTGQLPAGRQAPQRHLQWSPATCSTWSTYLSVGRPGKEAPCVLTSDRPAKDLPVPLIELTRRLACRLLPCVFPCRHLLPKKRCFWVSFSSRRIQSCLLAQRPRPESTNACIISEATSLVALTTART